MENKKLRSSEDSEINSHSTRKVIVLSSSSSSASSSTTNTTLISSHSSSSSSTILQPDFNSDERDEGEYSDGGNLGTKRKLITGSGGQQRVIQSEQSTKGGQVIVPEYGKPRDTGRRGSVSRDTDRHTDHHTTDHHNADYHARARGDATGDRWDKDQAISMLAALSSDDYKLKISAINYLIPKGPFNLDVFGILSAEIIKTNSPVDVRLAALEVLSKINFGKLPLIHSEILMLLRLSYEDLEQEIRCKALKTLESRLNVTTINLGSRPNFKDTTEITRRISAVFPKIDEKFDILSKLSTDLNLIETIFAVLCHVAANDTHRQVRLMAMEILGKVPIKNVRKPILLQAMKKDILKAEQLSETEENSERSGDAAVNLEKSSNKTTTKTRKENNLTSSLMPLLCCGVFAHGIEDQFVKIRFASLISLFSISNQSKSLTNSSICVFLDSLLDECDLIRLTALKFIGRLGKLALTVQNGLESLLAVFDDKNEEIRTEALKIIENNLISSGESGTITETILRTQRCIEAAIFKYPEMEFTSLKAMIKFMQRCQDDNEIGESNYLEFLGNLMQNNLPKYLLPSSLLPNYTSGSLTNVHLIMQIPFLKDEKVKRARLVKIFSRLSIDDAEKLKFLQSVKAVLKCDVCTSFKSRSIDPNSLNGSRLFKLLVVNNDNLECRYEAEKLTKRPFYFLKDSKPVAYLRINSVKIEDKRVLIDDYKLLGSTRHIKIALNTGETFEFKYGTTFVANLQEKPVAKIKIFNLSNNEIMYKQ